jgi:hypothetical protein
MFKRARLTILKNVGRLKNYNSAGLWPVIILYYFCQAAGQGRRAKLPGSLARQSCPAVWPGSLARQSGPAVWPGSLARQSGPAVWPGSLDRQSCRLHEVTTRVKIKKWKKFCVFSNNKPNIFAILPIPPSQISQN